MDEFDAILKFATICEQNNTVNDITFKKKNIYFFVHCTIDVFLLDQHLFGKCIRQR